MKSAKTQKLAPLQNNFYQCELNPRPALLLLDPDPRLGRSNADVLRRHGYGVNIAPDAETGWVKLQTHRYNLVITQNDLPGLSGVGLLKKLRFGNMRLPVIIAIRALPTWRSAEYPWLLQATKLFKPYSFEDLLGLVKAVFQTTGSICPEIFLQPVRQNQTGSVDSRSGKHSLR